MKEKDLIGQLIIALLLHTVMSLVSQLACFQLTVPFPVELTGVDQCKIDADYFCQSET